MLGPEELLGEVKTLTGWTLAGWASAVEKSDFPWLGTWGAGPWEGQAPVAKSHFCTRSDSTAVAATIASFHPSHEKRRVEPFEQAEYCVKTNV